MKFEKIIKKAVLLALIVSLALICGCSVSEPTESTDGSGTANTAPFVTEPISTDPVSTEPTGATDPEPTDPQPTEHEHTYTSTVASPTCTEGGCTTYTCDCGDAYTDNEVPALGHEWSDWEIVVEPTSEEEGLRRRVCNHCDAVEENIIGTVPAEHKHRYTETVVDPTCTEGGYTLFACDCGDSYKDKDVAALGHKWNAWETVIEPTTEAEGLSRRECENCDAKEEKAIAKLPPVHVHKYGATVVKPTCTEGGYTTYTCACGDTCRGNETAATGHDWTEWEVTKEPTTTETGKKERSCENCGAKDTGEIEKHKHSYTETVVKPTCTEQGYTLFTCDCGDSYKDKDVAALGHKWNAWETVIEPTTETEGLSRRECENCDAKEEKAIAKLPPVHVHKYSATVVDPTCTDGGYTTYTCSCGDTYRGNETAATGHNWGDWQMVIEPTNKTEGLRKRSCKNCNLSETNVVDKLESPHTHVYTSTVVEPTCTSGGYTLNVCACGYSIRTNKVDATDHDWSEWEVTKEPTTESAGTRKRTCTHCGKMETEAIPALDPDTGEAYERYIDPRIVIKHYSFGDTSYRYEDIGVVDTRTWGDPPSIWINDDGSWTVVYYQQNGTRVEVLVEIPPVGYIRSLIIRADGTYSFRMVGDPS